MKGPTLAIVPDILARHPAQMGFVEDDDPIQAFLPEAAYLPFRIAVQIGGAHRQPSHLGARVLQQRVSVARILAVPIVDQIPRKVVVDH